MRTTLPNPLLGPPPAEIPLSDAPLIRVLAQVRFGDILSIDEMVRSFQEAIRPSYPTLTTEDVLVETRSPQSATHIEPRRLWRFVDASDTWRATLTRDFLSLETQSYSSRTDFVQRFSHLLRALDTHIRPQIITRLGVRYIDRISGDALAEIPKLLRPEVAGISATTLGEHAVHSICETAYALPEEHATAVTRWGRLPPGASTDPFVIEPLDHPSWVFDVDVFAERQQSLDVRSLELQTRAFAERIYAIFRWAVTDEFLKRYGGQA